MTLYLKVLGAIFVTFALLSSSMPANAWNCEYKPGDEASILNGHTFKEEMWTTDVVNTSEDGMKHTFTTSFVNFDNFQAFLVAYNKGENGTKVSTLPYQFFGLHYFTPNGTEVFLGSVLAFLMAYNDSYNGTGPGQNHVMDPGLEPVYYIIPWGVGDTDLFKNDKSYIPTVEPIPVKKLGEGEYEFGMTYKNLYAKVIDGNSPFGFWVSMAFPIYLAKFSELTIRYHIKEDKANNKVVAETFYTIGQVDKLWIFGIPVDRSELPDLMGISAVHYVTMFNSVYSTVDNADKSIGDLSAGRTKPVDEIRMKVADQERAFDIGFRGTYDLKDEKNGNAPIATGEQAYNLLLGATLGDKILVGWQAGLSRPIMSTVAYGLSEQIQKDFTGPCDLANRSWQKFSSGSFWYAVAFPKWNGYRVEHDPIMTAYSSLGATEEEPKPAQHACGTKIIAAVSIMGAALVAGRYVIVRRRTERGDLWDRDGPIHIGGRKGR